MTDDTMAIETRFMQQLRRLRLAGPGQPPFEEVGISPAQLALLEWVAASPGCKLAGLAAGLHLTPPTVSVGVRRLEEAGLLARHPDPEDARARQFHLTEAGEKLWSRVQLYRREKVWGLLSGLSQDEQKMLVALLDRALRHAEQSS